jgi:hypothetical protein
MLVEVGIQMRLDNAIGLYIKRYSLYYANDDDFGKYTTTNILERYHKLLRDRADLTRPKTGHLGVILLDELQKGRDILEYEYRGRVGEALSSPSVDPFEALKYTILLGNEEKLQSFLNLRGNKRVEAQASLGLY